MFKAKNPDQTTYTYQGKRYTIYDAFPGKAWANKTAKHMRTRKGGIHTNTYTRVILSIWGRMRAGSDMRCSRRRDDRSEAR